MRVSAGLAFTILFTVAVAMSTGVLSVIAQGPGENIAVTYPVQETGVAPGDIIAQDGKTNNFRTTRIPNSSEMYGVVAARPLIVFQTDESSVPIVRTGQAEVNVTTANGPIEVGDMITSSYVRGYGRKAAENDTYKLGRALEPFSTSSATTTVQAGIDGEKTVMAGKILIDLTIGPMGSGVAQTDTNQSSSADVIRAFQPVTLAKYIVAAFVAVGAIYSSFRYFGKNLSAGVASIGRNPMAKASIKRMVILNVTSIILISLAGVALGVLILLLPVASTV